MTVRFAAAVIAVVMLAIPATAQNTNNPIPGVDIIVQKKPGGEALRVGPTNEHGQVDFVAEPGGIAVLLPAVQACREAARRSSARSSPPGGVVARVEVGRMIRTSAPLMFDSRDPGRFMGPDGREMVIAIPREGARVRVTLVPCCWATDSRGPTGDAAPDRRAPTDASGVWDDTDIVHRSEGGTVPRGQSEEEATREAAVVTGRVTNAGGQPESGPAQPGPRGGSASGAASSRSPTRGDRP